jgi:hypothetical protein
VSGPLGSLAARLACLRAAALVPICVCRVLVIPLLTTSLISCTTWRVAGPTPAEYVQKHQPSSLRVTLLESSTVILRAPLVQGDTVLGKPDGSRHRGTADAQASAKPRNARSPRLPAIPLADVQLAEVRKGDAGRTALITFGVLFAATITISAAGVACVASEAGRRGEVVAGGGGHAEGGAARRPEPAPPVFTTFTPLSASLHRTSSILHMDAWTPSKEGAMRRVCRLSLLIPLLATGAIPAASSGCGNGIGFHCQDEGQSCATTGDCCGDLMCYSGKCGWSAPAPGESQ